MPIVQAAIHGFGLNAAIDADQSPGEVIVYRRLRARRNHEREQTERSVFGAIERVLPDAAAHAALEIGLAVLLRQPAVSSKELCERRPQSFDARRRVGDVLR